MGLFNFKSGKKGKKSVRFVLHIKKRHSKHSKKRHAKPIDKKHAKTARRWNFGFNKGKSSKKVRTPEIKPVKAVRKKPVKKEQVKAGKKWYSVFSMKRPAKPADNDLADVAENLPEPVQLAPQNEPSKSDKNAKGLEARLEQFEKNNMKNTEVTNKSVASVKELILQLKKDVDDIKKENRVFHGRRKKHKKEEPDSDIAELEEQSTTDMTNSQKEEKIKEIEDSEIIETSYSSGKKIETSLDTLYDLISKKGAIRMMDAAKVMHASASQVEEWARMLEEHNLVEIHYPAVGKPILKLKK